MEKSIFVVWSSDSIFKFKIGGIGFKNVRGEISLFPLLCHKKRKVGVILF